MNMKSGENEKEQVNAKFNELNAQRTEAHQTEQQRIKQQQIEAQRQNNVQLHPLSDQLVTPLKVEAVAPKGKEIAPFDADDPNWKTIYARFKKEFPNGEVNDEGALKFPNPGAAKEFFETLAKENMPFLAIRMENGKKTDNLLFSCGSGKLYEGGLNDIKNQLKSDLTTETDPDVKKRLEEGFKTIESYEQRGLTTNKEESEEPTSPRPGGG